MASTGRSSGLDGLSLHRGSWSLKTRGRRQQSFCHFKSGVETCLCSSLFLPIARSPPLTDPVRGRRLAWRYLGEPPLMPRHASTTLAPPALHAWRTAPPRSSEPPSGPTASATARVRHAIDSLINVSTPIHPAGAPIVLLVVPSIFVDQAVGSDRLRLVPVLTAPRRT